MRMQAGNAAAWGRSRHVLVRRLLVQFPWLYLVQRAFWVRPHAIEPLRSVSVTVADSS